MSPQRVQVQGDLFHGVVPDGAVYIGRAAPGLPASPYANPFPVKTFGLDISLESYDEYLRQHPILVQRAVEEIGDSDMACWCKPGARCHGDLLRAAMVRARHCAGALDRIPETPTIDTREALQERLDALRAERDKAVMGRAQAAACAAVEARHDELAGIAIPHVVMERSAVIAVKAAAPILREAGRQEANSAITWGTTCLNDARLLDACYDADQRREAASAVAYELLDLSSQLLGWVHMVDVGGDERERAKWRERLERARAVLGETEN